MRFRNRPVLVTFDHVPELDALITQVAEFNNISKSELILSLVMEHKPALEEVVRLIKLRNQMVAARAAETKDEYLPF